MTREIDIDLKKLQEICGGDVQKAIDTIKAKELEWPKSPKKPYLKNQHNATDVFEYAKELSNYEKDKKIYDLGLKDVQEYNNKLECVLVEYIQEEAGLNNLPKDKRSKVWNLAWERGHASGFYEVYQNLVDLVDLF